MSRHMRAYRLPGIPKTCFSLICLKLLPGRPHAVFNKKQKNLLKHTSCLSEAI
uniref:Uncharacterized protein n=1 Tax=Anguilla anguilla TaxID=7936 RepID=A0A0E9TGZ0_ANGAN